MKFTCLAASLQVDTGPIEVPDATALASVLHVRTCRRASAMSTGTLAAQGYPARPLCDGAAGRLQTHGGLHAWLSRQHVTRYEPCPRVTCLISATCAAKGLRTGPCACSLWTAIDPLPKHTKIRSPTTSKQRAARWLSPEATTECLHQNCAKPAASCLQRCKCPGQRGQHLRSVAPSPP